MAQDKLREESDTKCHPERSEGSDETLRFAQGDTKRVFFNSLSQVSIFTMKLPILAPVFFAIGWHFTFSM